MLLQSRQWNKTVLPFLSLCLNKSSSRLPFRIFPISWARNCSNSKKDQRMSNELWVILYDSGFIRHYSDYNTTVWIKITCQIRQHIKYLNISMCCSCHKNRFFIFINNSKNFSSSYPARTKFKEIGCLFSLWKLRKAESNNQYFELFCFWLRFNKSVLPQNFSNFTTGYEEPGYRLHFVCTSNFLYLAVYNHSFGTKKTENLKRFKVLVIWFRWNLLDTHDSLLIAINHDGHLFSENFSI